MIKFTPTTPDDRRQIQDWLSSDPYHCAGADTTTTEWWLTGTDCLVAGCIEDASGPAMYFRMDKEGDLVRLHCQFAPVDSVNKLRVVRVIKEAMPKLEFLAKSKGGKGFVFESTSLMLIRFMHRLGFEPRLDKENDYVQMFSGESPCVDRAEHRPE